MKRRKHRRAAVIAAALAMAAPAPAVVASSVPATRIARSHAARIHRVTGDLDYAFALAAGALERSLATTSSREGWGFEVATAELHAARLRRLVFAFDQAIQAVAIPPEQPAEVFEVVPAAADVASPRVAAHRLLDRLDAESCLVGDAATLLLDDALCDLDRLSPAERVVMREAVEHHLTEAEAALATAITRHAAQADRKRAALLTIELAEYQATCERMREVHALLA